MKIAKEKVLLEMSEKLEKSLSVHRVIPPPKLKPANKDEELFGLMFSDCQIGLKTQTYNVKVFEERLKTYINNYRIILRKERRSIPVRNVAVFMLGDILHNDIIGRFLTLDEFELVVIKQWENVALPNLEMFVGELLKDFEKVSIYAVMGNHGNYQSLSFNDNFDLLTYKTLKMLFRNEPRIDWHISEHFNLLTTIMGKRFHLCHGDQMACYNGTPYFAMIRKTLNWSNSYGAFDYQFFGHFHHCVFFYLSKLIMMINGTFVSDCEYTMKRLGVNAPPRQWCFSIHPTYGITAKWEIHLDK